MSSARCGTAATSRTIRTQYPQPRVLIDGLPRRAPWIDLADLRARGAALVWTEGDQARAAAGFRRDRAGRGTRGNRSICRRIATTAPCMSAGPFCARPRHDPLDLPRQRRGANFRPQPERAITMPKTMPIISGSRHSGRLLWLGAVPASDRVRVSSARPGLAAINADYPQISSSGSFPVDQVSFGPAFQSLLDELESDEFREAFEEKFSLDLSGPADRHHGARPLRRQRRQNPHQFDQQDHHRADLHERKLGAARRPAAPAALAATISTTSSSKCRRSPARCSRSNAATIPGTATSRSRASGASSSSTGSLRKATGKSPCCGTTPRRRSSACCKRSCRAAPSIVTRAGRRRPITTGAGERRRQEPLFDPARGRSASTATSAKSC